MNHRNGILNNLDKLKANHEGIKAHSHHQWMKMADTSNSTVEEDPDVDIGSTPSGASSSINQTVDSSVVDLGPSKSRLHVIRRFSNFLTVEPMLFFHMIAWSANGVIVQNFYIERICQREYWGNSSIDCGNLTAHAAAEAHVEGIASYYSTYRNLIEAGLPVIFSLFIGPWSDKHGSKPPMILSLFGYILSSVLLYLFAMPKYVDPAILLFAGIPIALSGGAIAFLLSAFRYVAAFSTTKNRSFRMAVAEGSWFLGSPIGLLGSAALLKYGGYQLVFLSCMICFSVALLYALFCIKSDKPETDLGSSNSSFFQDIFNVEAVKETLLTAFRKRSGSQRMWILMLLGTIYLRIFTVYGSMFITFFYTRKKFQWDSANYSAYTTYDGIVAIAGSSVVAILGMKIFKVSDTKIGLLSAVSYFAGAVVWVISSFTTFGWMMYLGATIQMFCGLITIVGRSMLSKLVHKDEVGKIYSFLASGEAAIPLIASPIYNLLYSATLDSFPGAVYVLTSSLDFLILLSFIYFCTSSWNSTISQHEQLDEDMEEEAQREVDA